MLSNEELASLNELRVEEDLDFSDEDASPEDVSLLDSGMDSNAMPASFQEQEIDPLYDESDLVEDSEDFLPDYALSFKDSASSKVVPVLEEPLSDNVLSLADAASSDLVPVLEEPYCIEHADSNEINVSPAAPISGNESEEIPSSSLLNSAALPSLEGESLTDPEFVAVSSSSVSSRRPRRIVKPQRPLDDQYFFYK